MTNYYSNNWGLWRCKDGIVQYWADDSWGEALRSLDIPEKLVNSNIPLVTNLRRLKQRFPKAFEIKEDRRESVIANWQQA